MAFYISTLLTLSALCGLIITISNSSLDEIMEMAVAFFVTAIYFFIMYKLLRKTDIPEDYYPVVALAVIVIPAIIIIYIVIWVF